MSCSKSRQRQFGCEKNYSKSPTVAAPQGKLPEKSDPGLFLKTTRVYFFPEIVSKAKILLKNKPGSLFSL
jgi:hypothetical protein